MPDGKTMLILAAVGAILLVGDKTVHGIKKLDRKVCHIVTLHHKCNPEKSTTSTVPDTK